ncbi:MAG: 50S ribosomal protein L17 [Eggerthellaceae bacterium]|nr:50S ribosomal protein L17 [Eggerthellaceae bacterium]
MRHKYKGRKLGTDWSHTQAMKRSLVQQLFLNDRIKTIESRAKEIRPDVDKIITWAKKGDLHSRRLAIAKLGNDKELVREIFEKVSQGMFEGRPGGYTRIMKLGPRKGDGAPMVIMELVTENCVPKAEKKAAASKKAAPKKAAAKKAAPKKAEKAEESVVEELKESVEAAEENFAAEVQEPAVEAIEAKEAEAEKKEAKAEKADAKEAEEVREEEFKAEEAKAEEAKAESLKAADEEKAK